MAPLLDPLGLAGRRELELDLLDMNLLRDRTRRRRAVAGQDGQVCEPQVLQVVDHIVGRPPHPVASTDHAQHLAVAHKHSAV